jgi:hypothetical protein
MHGIHFVMWYWHLSESGRLRCVLVGYLQCDPRGDVVYRVSGQHLQCHVAHVDGWDDLMLDVCAGLHIAGWRKHVLDVRRFMPIGPVFFAQFNGFCIVSCVCGGTIQ